MKEIKIDPYCLSVNNPREASAMLFRENKGDQTLPVWLNILEAQSIAIEFAKASKLSVTTIGFVKVLESAGLKIEKVVFDEVKDETQFATVYYKNNQKPDKIVMKAPMAVGVGISTSAPFFTNEDVLSQSKVLDRKILDSNFGTLERGMGVLH